MIYNRFGVMLNKDYHGYVAHQPRMVVRDEYVMSPMLIIAAALAAAVITFTLA